MKNKLIDLLKLLICFIFFFSLSPIIKYILKLFNINTLSNKGTVIFQFLISFFITILLLSIYFKKYKTDLIEIKKDIKKNIVFIIKMFVLFIVVKYLISFISVLILILLGFDTNLIVSVNQDMIESYIKSSPILMLISVSIFAPFYEEGIFRLGFKKIIKNKYIFIILSGSLFGLMHIFPLDEGVTLAVGIIQSISYVTMGIFLSFIYYKTDNIYTSIGIHFLNNFISVLAMIKFIDFL